MLEIIRPSNVLGEVHAKNVSFISVMFILVFKYVQDTSQIMLRMKMKFSDACLLNLAICIGAS